MLADTETVLDLIPQRNPFVLVHRLLSCNEQGATSEFQVQADHLLVQNGFLSEAGLMEHIAQTGAARMGYLCRRDNQPVPVGFIGAIQRWEVSRLPKVNEVLQTTIELKNQVFSASIITGTVKVKDVAIASCEMKIFISSSP